MSNKTVKTNGTELKEFTAIELRKLKKADLIVLATSLEIPLQEDGKERNKMHLLEDVLKRHRQVRSRQRVPYIEITKAIQKIIDDKSLSKSQKIRSLQDVGMPTTQIAVVTNAHYSFTHQVVTKYKYDKKNKLTSIQSDDTASSVKKEEKPTSAKKTTSRKKTTSKSTKKTTTSTK